MLLQLQNHLHYRSALADSLFIRLGQPSARAKGAFSGCSKPWFGTRGMLQTYQFCRWTASCNQRRMSYDFVPRGLGAEQYLFRVAGLGVLWLRLGRR